MKKNLSRCTDCSDDTSILIQVNSGPEVVLLCSDWYNIKYSKEISYFKEEEKKLNLRRKNLVFMDLEDLTI